jgi:hypothetical protein
MVNKKDEAKKQFSDISVILNNIQFNDYIKEQKIQEYIDKKNKKFATKINLQLKFLSKRDSTIPEDYIAIVNKYKNNQSKEIKEIYNFIEKIVFYSLYYINIDKTEYGYLDNSNNHYITSESGISKKIKLKNTEKNYLDMSKLKKDDIIKKSFDILEKRYIEFKNTLSISFSDEDIFQTTLSS